MAENERHGSPPGDAPEFLIKHGDVYYFAVAVVAYDPAQARTEREREGCRRVAQLFRDQPNISLELRWAPGGAGLGGGHGIHTDPVWNGPGAGQQIGPAGGGD